MKYVLSLLVAALAAGCSSISITNEGGRTMCLVSNYGWRLWDLIPVASGNPLAPNEPGCLWFRDTVTLESNQLMIDQAIRRVGATGVRFQNSYMTDEQSMFTFYRRSYYTSAELIFDAPLPFRVKMAETAIEEGEEDE